MSIRSEIDAETNSYVQMREALRKLVFAARTSGGTAERDELLCKACDEAEVILKKDV